MAPLFSPGRGLEVESAGLALGVHVSKSDRLVLVDFIQTGREVLASEFRRKLLGVRGGHIGSYSLTAMRQAVKPSLHFFYGVMRA